MDLNAYPILIGVTSAGMSVEIATAMVGAVVLSILPTLRWSATTRHWFTAAGNQIGLFGIGKLLPLWINDALIAVFFNGHHEAEAPTKPTAFNSNDIVRRCAITWLTDCGDLLEHTKAQARTFPPYCTKVQ